GSVRGSSPCGSTGVVLNVASLVTPAKRSIGQWIWAGLGLVVLGLALWGIKLIAGQVTWAEIVADMHATPPHLLVAAAASAAGSYFVLIGYDWLSVRHLGYRLPFRT